MFDVWGSEAWFFDIGRVASSLKVVILLTKLHVFVNEERCWICSQWEKKEENPQEQEHWQSILSLKGQALQKELCFNYLKS